MTRKWKTPEDVPKGSFQSMSPRFQGEAFYDNLKIVDELDRLAKEKGLETSQLALAWVVGLSPYVSRRLIGGTGLTSDHPHPWIIKCQASQAKYRICRYQAFRR
jgi:hypothetical protein